MHSLCFTNIFQFTSLLMAIDPLLWKSSLSSCISLILPSTYPRCCCNRRNEVNTRGECSPTPSTRSLLRRWVSFTALILSCTYNTLSSIWHNFAHAFVSLKCTQFCVLVFFVYRRYEASTQLHQTHRTLLQRWVNFSQLWFYHLLFDIGFHTISNTSTSGTHCSIY